jgi:plasmid stabilization system protein ParE
MTAARIIWSAQAAGQLEAIVEFIAAGSPTEARRFAARVLRRVESLAPYPALGGGLPRMKAARIENYSRAVTASSIEPRTKLCSS